MVAEWASSTVEAETSCHSLNLSTYSQIWVGRGCYHDSVSYPFLCGVHMKGLHQFLRLVCLATS